MKGETDGAKQKYSNSSPKPSLFNNYIKYRWDDEHLKLWDFGGCWWKNILAGFTEEGWKQPLTLAWGWLRSSLRESGLRGQSLRPAGTAGPKDLTHSWADKSTYCYTSWVEFAVNLQPKDRPLPGSLLTPQGSRVWPLPLGWQRFSPWPNSSQAPLGLFN